MLRGTWTPRLGPLQQYLLLLALALAHPWSDAWPQGSAADGLREALHEHNKNHNYEDAQVQQASHEALVQHKTDFQIPVEQASHEALVQDGTKFHEYIPVNKASHDVVLEQEAEYYGDVLLHQASNEDLVLPWHEGTAANNIEYAHALAHDFTQGGTFGTDSGSSKEKHAPGSDIASASASDAGSYEQDYLHKRTFDSETDSHEEDYDAQINGEADHLSDGTLKSGHSKEESPLPLDVHHLLEPTPPPLHSFPVTDPRRWIWIADSSIRIGWPTKFSLSLNKAVTAYWMSLTHPLNHHAYASATLYDMQALYHQWEGLGSAAMYGGELWALIGPHHWPYPLLNYTITTPELLPGRNSNGHGVSTEPVIRSSVSDLEGVVTAVTLNWAPNPFTFTGGTESPGETLSHTKKPMATSPTKYRLRLWEGTDLMQEVITSSRSKDKGLSGTLSQLSLDKTYKVTLDGLDHDDEVIATLSFTIQSGSLVVAGDVRTTDGVSGCFSGLQVRCPGHDRCVSPYWICDGSNDCPDGADEQGCLEETCDGFSCWGDICIPATWRCDGHEDCKDGDDEYGCGECGSQEFLCPTGGTCISANATCDGYNHCPDGWDESAAVCDVEICSPGEHPCGTSGRCVAHDLLCDSILHCPEGEDEEHEFCKALKLVRNLPELSQQPQDNLSGSILTTEEPGIKEQNKSCLVDEWSCESGQCIGRLYICDGYRDCTDGTDETEGACEQAHLDMAEAIQRLSQSKEELESAESTIVQGEDESSSEVKHNVEDIDTTEEYSHNSLLDEDFKVEDKSIISKKHSEITHGDDTATSEVNGEEQIEIVANRACELNQILCSSGECVETEKLCHDLNKEMGFNNKKSGVLPKVLNNESNIHTEPEISYQVENDKELDIGHTVPSNSFENNAVDQESQELLFGNNIDIDVEVEIEGTDLPIYEDTIKNEQNHNLQHDIIEDADNDLIPNIKNYTMNLNMTTDTSTKVLSNTSSNCNNNTINQAINIKVNKSAITNLNIYQPTAVINENKSAELSNTTNEGLLNVTKSINITEVTLDENVSPEYDYHDYHDLHLHGYNEGDSSINCTEFAGNPWEIAHIPDTNQENIITKVDENISYDPNTDEPNITDFFGNQGEVHNDVGGNNFHIDFSDSFPNSDLDINIDSLIDSSETEHKNEKDESIINETSYNENNGDDLIKNRAFDSELEIKIMNNNINDSLANINTDSSKSNIQENKTVNVANDLDMDEKSFNNSVDINNHTTLLKSNDKGTANDIISKNPMNHTVIIAIHTEIANGNNPNYVIQGQDGRTYEYEIINIQNQETRTDTYIDQLIAERKRKLESFEDIEEHSSMLEVTYKIDSILQDNHQNETTLSSHESDSSENNKCDCSNFMNEQILSSNTYNFANKPYLLEEPTTKSPITVPTTSTRTTSSTITPVLIPTSQTTSTSSLPNYKNADRHVTEQPSTIKQITKNIQSPLDELQSNDENKIDLLSESYDIENNMIYGNVIDNNFIADDDQDDLSFNLKTNIRKHKLNSEERILQELDTGGGITFDLNKDYGEKDFNGISNDISQDVHMKSALESSKSSSSRLNINELNSLFILSMLFCVMYNTNFIKVL